MSQQYFSIVIDLINIYIYIYFFSIHLLLYLCSFTHQTLLKWCDWVQIYHWCNEYIFLVNKIPNHIHGNFLKAKYKISKVWLLSQCLKFQKDWQISDVNMNAVNNKSLMDWYRNKWSGGLWSTQGISRWHVCNLETLDTNGVVCSILSWAHTLDVKNRELRGKI